MHNSFLSWTTSQLAKIKLKKIDLLHAPGIKYFLLYSKNFLEYVNFEAISWNLLSTWFKFASFAIKSPMAFVTQRLVSKERLLKWTKDLGF